MKNTPFVVTLAAFLLPAGACQKEQLKPLADAAFQQTGKFHSTFVLTDIKGENQATIELSADDKTALEVFSAKNFQFEPLFEAPRAAGISQGQRRPAPASDGALDLHLSIRDAELRPGVRGVRLLILPKIPETANARSNTTVNWWFHNNVGGDLRNRTTNVGDCVHSFYWEGTYWGFWPYWQRSAIETWTACGGAGSYCRNLSIHITAVESGVDSIPVEYFW